MPENIGFLLLALSGVTEIGGFAVTAAQARAIGGDDVIRPSVTLSELNLSLDRFQMQLRAEFSLLDAILRDRGEINQRQIDDYKKHRPTMSAQQALEASGIVLTGEHSSAFLATSANIASATEQYDHALKKIKNA